MKRYHFEAEAYSGVGYPVEWDGESEEELYVKAEDAEALEQLNKEMLEVLKEAHNEIVGLKVIYEGYDAENHPLLKQIKSIITKAEEAT